LNRQRIASLLLVGAVLLGGCARADVSPQSAGQTVSRSAIQRTLVLVAQQVPLTFAAIPLGGSATGLSINIPLTIFNANLATADQRGNPLPFLAESLPQLNTDSWRVFPDGTMETTYRLKPNLTWHDGQPLTADDFVFGEQVYTTPEYGVSPILARRSRSAVLAPDSRTVLVKWKQPFADANILGNELAPLPRHLLEQAHRDSLGTGANSPAFLPNSTFWTSDYVGAGAYKVDQYVPGTAIEASAFDGFVFGRPIIDRVSIRGIADPNGALASLLSGEVHMSFDNFRGDPAEILQQRWGTTADSEGVQRGPGGTVLWSVTSQGGRGWFFQFRPEFAQPLELATDVRVRRAIASAIERQPMFEVAASGRGVVSETFTNKDDPEFAEVDRAVQGLKNPYDPRRSQQLLEEAGFRRESDGKWTTPSGGLFETTVWYTAGASGFEQGNAIFADYLNRVGISAVSRPFNTQTQSAMQRALLPGMSQGNPGDVNGLLSLHSRNVPTAETRWAGAAGNRHGFANPQYDRLVEAFEAALAPSELNRLAVEMEKAVLENLPTIYTWIEGVPFAHVAALKGPENRWNRRAAVPGSNIYTWYWES